ncbi:hypothetical protein CspeluHIS016_0600600 [Cutaneotrichosporon spelunceum]|uniref:MARVEL domain-containing protein n=1 Tax=Cutaneotrichosporon spelunceum TaxID=1672016 RepID=A0AAD3TXC2_9TREE|nr:hypothetical protein CspeluHIS016_0600600 [Cutaneotrichosporon spelunceum]
MKPSTVLTILYGLTLVTALVGAGFLAAFLGQLYAEDPLLVFQMPVAVWVNGVVAFFGVLIVYVVIWLIFRATHFESGFSSVVGDTFAILFFIMGGVAATAGLTGEDVFRLNCRTQPMRSDVLALCLPAAIGTAIAWAEIGLLLLTLIYIVATMRYFPDGWKHSMYRLCHPRETRPVIQLDKNDSGSAGSSFGPPYSPMERRPLVGLGPQYPLPGAPGRNRTYRSGSDSSGSLMSPISPLSPTSPMEGWQSQWGSALGKWPNPVQPGDIYPAYSGAAPTQSYWSNGPAIQRPQPLEMDRRGNRLSLSLERLVTPPSPQDPSNLSQGHFDPSPAPLANPRPLPPLPAHAQHLQTPPHAPGFGARPRSDSASSKPTLLEKECMAAIDLDAKPRHRSDSASSQPSLLEKGYLAATLSARPLSLTRDFETVSVSSNSPSWLQSKSYPPEKFTYTYEKAYTYEQAAPLTPQSPTPHSTPPITTSTRSPTSSTPPRPTTTPKMRREFRQCGNVLAPLPPPWGVDARDKDYERECERTTEVEIARARPKLSLEVQGSSSRSSGLPTPPRAHSRLPTTPGAQNGYREFGYPSDTRLPKKALLVPQPTSPGEALSMPLPPEEWEVKPVRPGFRRL